jgi:hypothetical protein
MVILSKNSINTSKLVEIFSINTITLEHGKHFNSENIKTKLIVMSSDTITSASCVMVIFQHLELFSSI